MGRFNKWMMLVVYPFYLYLVSARVHVLPSVVSTPLVPCALPNRTRQYLLQAFVAASVNVVLTADVSRCLAQRQTENPGKCSDALYSLAVKR